MTEQKNLLAREQVETNNYFISPRTCGSKKKGSSHQLIKKAPKKTKFEESSDGDSERRLYSADSFIDDVESSDDEPLGMDRVDSLRFYSACTDDEDRSINESTDGYSLKEPIPSNFNQYHENIRFDASNMIWCGERSHNNTINHRLQLVTYEERQNSVRVLDADFGCSVLAYELVLTQNPDGSKYMKPIVDEQHPPVRVHAIRRDTNLKNDQLLREVHPSSAQSNPQDRTYRFPLYKSTMRNEIAHPSDATETVRQTVSNLEPYIDASIHLANSLRPYYCEHDFKYIYGLNARFCADRGVQKLMRPKKLVLLQDALTGKLVQREIICLIGAQDRVIMFLDCCQAIQDSLAGRRIESTSFGEVYLGYEFSYQLPPRTSDLVPSTPLVIPNSYRSDENEIAIKVSHCGFEVPADVYDVEELVRMANGTLRKGNENMFQEIKAMKYLEQEVDAYRQKLQSNHVPDDEEGMIFDEEPMHDDDIFTDNHQLTTTPNPLVRSGGMKTPLTDSSTTENNANTAPVPDYSKAHFIRCRHLYKDPINFYMTMKYYPLRSLFDYMQTKPLFNYILEEQAKKILLDVVLSMDYLHSHGMIHQDLSTENIILDHLNSMLDATNRVVSPGTSSSTRAQQLINNRNSDDNIPVEQLQFILMDFGQCVGLPYNPSSRTFEDLLRKPSSCVGKVMYHCPELCSSYLPDGWRLPNANDPNAGISTYNLSTRTSASTSSIASNTSEYYHGYSVDSWQVGIFLYVIITGQPPFDFSLDPPASRGLPEQKYTWFDYLYHEGSVRGRWIRMKHPVTLAEEEYQMSDRFSPELIDLLDHLLCYDPLRRYSMKDILHHPWLSSVVNARR